jgi:nickel-dependent lactate racemase
VTRTLSLGGLEEPCDGGALQQAIEHACSSLSGARHITVLIPDLTRSLPTAGILRQLVPALEQVGEVTLLVALGTHPTLSEKQLTQLTGLSRSARQATWTRTRLVQHDWLDSDSHRSAGRLASALVQELTSGAMTDGLDVVLNRLVVETSAVLILGPVFPHEVAGFSGGAKYLVPGVAGAELIHMTHWIGALATNLATIGREDTPVRRIIHAAAELLPHPVHALSFVLAQPGVMQIHSGTHDESWSAAVQGARVLNTRAVDAPVLRVLAQPALRYGDMWTAAKAIYKTEPIVKTGGEIVVYAPHITSLSVVHQSMLMQVGYHIKDYFLSDWPRFESVPGAILAHSSHVRGSGVMLAGRELPRISVTLATGISREVCERVGLGWSDPGRIDAEAFDLHVRDAGEVLYRVQA